MVSIDICQLSQNSEKNPVKCPVGGLAGKNHALFVKARGDALSKKSIVIHPRGHKMWKKKPHDRGGKEAHRGWLIPWKRLAARLVWPMARTRIIQPPFNHSARGINSKGLALISFHAHTRARSVECLRDSPGGEEATSTKAKTEFQTFSDRSEWQWRQRKFRPS